jgi:hypothetical protein
MRSPIPRSIVSRDLFEIRRLLHNFMGRSCSIVIRADASTNKAKLVGMEITPTMRSQRSALMDFSVTEFNQSNGHAFNGPDCV